MSTALRRPVGHEQRMSIVEHLDELRSRLITCVLTFILCFGVAYWQNDRILNWINEPLESTQNLEGTEKSNDPLEQTARFQVQIAQGLNANAAAIAAIQKGQEALAGERGISEATKRQIAAQALAVAAAQRELREASSSRPSSKRQPVTLGVTEPFVTTFTVAGYAALLLALPLILWQAYAFVLPAFSPAERRTALPLMLMVPVLFIGGVAFAYFVALPRAVDFLQNFNDDDFDILIQAKDYYRFAILFMGVIGILFQIPVGVLAVTRLGIVSVKQLAANRGYVLLGIAVLAAVATPTPDPITMLFSMAPLIVLFELSLILARLMNRGDRPSRWAWDDADEEDDEDDPYWDEDDYPDR